MSELEKYQIIENNSLLLLNQEINDYVKQGYKLHTFTALELQEDYGKEPQYVAVMSLSTPNKYTDIANLKDVSPDEVDELLAEGWIVADSFSKFLRMVKPVGAV